MLKRFICVIISLVVALPLMACNLIQHNYDRDYRQVIAVIDSFSETNSAGVTFTYPGKKIYKYDLVNVLNSNADSYMQQNQGVTVQATVEYFMNNLITRELVVLDVDRQITFGAMTWRGFFDPTEGDFDATKLEGRADYTDSNKVVKAIYEGIDSTLASIKSDIYRDWQLDAPLGSGAAEEPAAPTYPIQPTEDDEEDKDEVAEEMYIPDEAKWPGYYDEDKSFGEEVMRRFIRLIRDRVKDNFQVTDADKEKFKRDDEFIDGIANTKGLTYVYPELYKTHYIQFLIGKSAIDNVKFEKIQSTIEDSVTVTAADVRNKYDSLVEEQKATYANDITVYNTAMKEGTTTVLVHPSSNHFYVKHILLPFSEEQKAELAKVTNPFAIEAKKRELVDKTVVYAHVNGEDDTKVKLTVEQVFNEVRAAMAPVKNSVKESEREFDRLIYKYNTDPGIFGNAKGYVEVAVLGAGESETYMPEFAKAARELYKNYKVGEVLPTYAITSYGVHIMYLANRFTGTPAKPQIIPLEGYETPGQYKTVYEIIEEEEKAARINQAYTNWEERTIRIYRDVKKVYETFTNRFKDLYEQ